MEKHVLTKEGSGVDWVDTYDFASPVERVKAIDLAMKHYFGTRDWPVAKAREFPGLRSTVVGSEVTRHSKDGERE